MKVCEAMSLAGDALNATLSGVFGIAVSFLNLESVPAKVAAADALVV